MIAGSTERNIARKGLLLGSQYRGDEGPARETRKDEEVCGEDECRNGSPERGIEPEERDGHDECKLYHSDPGSGKHLFPRGQLDRREGRDEELSEGSHFAFPYHGHCGEEQAYQEHDHPDYGRHIVDARLERWVEPGARSEIDAGPASGAPAADSAARRRPTSCTILAA